MQNSEDDQLNKLSEQVIGLCIEVHKTLGPGLLESAYAKCLAFEFQNTGIAFEKEVALPIQYKGVKLASGYRLDFVVDGVLVLELKSVDALLPIHKAQMLTYLRLRRAPLGLLINFNVPLLKHGIVRLRN